MRRESSEHKYAIIVHTLQARIDRATYPVGSLLPSEADLVREFGASRSTVVRALDYLRQASWLRSQQGRGRIVLGRPAPPMPPLPERVRRMLGAEHADITLLRVGPTSASPRMAAALALPPRSRLVARRRLVGDDETPTALEVVYAPVELARHSGVNLSVPLPDGLVPSLQRNGAEPHHVTETLSARTPSVRESLLVHIGRRDCLVALLLVLRTRDDRPLIAIEAMLRAEQPALEATFPLV
ncbi:MAG TPA: GntR family transcriptional regulator [Micromonosporaceae bacterium]|nr:GntR family transcriptional regulator [Micromonosporaceae bacterium]